MPRAKPIPQRELEIARRFKEARLEARATRSYVAARLGVDSQAIARIELGRSVLRCGVAAKFCEEFQISQRWLATGVGRDDPYVHLPDELSCPDLAFAPDGSFSQMYDRVLAPHCEAFYRIDGPSILRQMRRILYARPVGQHGPGTPEKEGEVMSRAVRELVNYLKSVLPHFLYPWLFDAFRNAAGELVQASGLRIDYDNKATGRDTAPTARAIEGGRTPPAPIVATGAGRRSDEGPQGCGFSNTQKEVDAISSVMLNPPAMVKCLTWETLRKRLVNVTGREGAKSELAAALGVSPASVSQWRHDAARPDADKTMRLLAWVENQEKKHGALKPPTPPAAKLPAKKKG